MARAKSGKGSPDDVGIRLMSPSGFVRSSFRTMSRAPSSYPNNLGDVLRLRSTGFVAFTVAGSELRMTAIDYDDRLWFVFRDLTSGSETYPATRFLYADVPSGDGWTIIDFNRAYNPPCAFNPYTTCPLPPRENRLAGADRGRGTRLQAVMLGPFDGGRVEHSSAVRPTFV